MEGSDNITLEVFKFVCGSLFTKVETAVTTLRDGATLTTKRARLEGAFFTSPSDYGKDSEGEPWIEDHRPFSGLHVSLQVEAFGHFIDRMDMEDGQIEPMFYEVATSLMKTMSKTFRFKDQRTTSFGTEMKKLFPLLAPVSGEHYKSDLTLQVEINKQKSTLMNVEISSDPVAQNQSYFVHMQKKGHDRAPMLLVAVVGCHFLQVFGAAWNGSVVSHDPLCSPVSLLFVPRDPNHAVSKMAHVLAALHSTVEKLEEYYSRSLTERITLSKGPYFNLGGLEDKKQMGAIKWLFKAKLNGEDVVVKFSRSHYGTDVHNLLAEHGLAPQLKYTQVLPGNWHVVIMEKVTGVSLPASEQVNMALKDTVDKIHAQGYVHGDLRAQNILVVDDSIRILDFDWAGKEGEVRYPQELNTSCNWHSDVKPGGLIAKEHDVYQINTICGP